MANTLGNKKKLNQEYIFGKWGPYQLFQYSIVFISIWPTGFQVLAVVFIGYRPDFSCSKVPYDTNSSIYYEYKECKIEIRSNVTNGTLVKETGCVNGYTYMLNKDSTFVTEMDLVCDREELAELSQTLVMAGQLVGAVIASSISDRLGRKTVHLCSHLATFVIGIGLAFVSDYTTLAALRFVLGVLQQGIVTSGAVIGLELFPEKTRFMSEFLRLVSWTTGVCLMAPVAYLLRNYSWRYLQIAFTSLSVYSLFQYWIQDESLRWLVVNGKVKRVEKLVQKISRWNNIDYDDLYKIVKNRMNENNLEMSDKDKKIQKFNSDLKTTGKESDLPNGACPDKYIVKKYTIFAILRNRPVLVNTLILWFVWSTNNLTYFGLTLTSSSLAGNRYLNFFLSCIVEYIAAILEFFMLRRFGRKVACIAFHTVCGVSLVLATVLNYFADGNSTYITFSVVFTFVAKMAITGSFSTIFLYTPELYPTNVRNVGIGFASAAASISGMLAPFAGTLAKHKKWAPGTIFSVMCLTVSLIVLYLPETRDYDLPQTMTELKAWYKEHSGLRKKGNRLSRNENKNVKRNINNKIESTKF